MLQPSQHLSLWFSVFYVTTIGNIPSHCSGGLWLETWRTFGGKEHERGCLYWVFPQAPVINAFNNIHNKPQKAFKNKVMSVGALGPRTLGRKCSYQIRWHNKPLLHPAPSCTPTDTPSPYRHLKREREMHAGAPDAKQATRFLWALATSPPTGPCLTFLEHVEVVQQAGRLAVGDPGRGVDLSRRVALFVGVDLAGSVGVMKRVRIVRPCVLERVRLGDGSVRPMGWRCVVKACRRAVTSPGPEPVAVHSVCLAEVEGGGREPREVSLGSQGPATSAELFPQPCIVFYWEFGPFLFLRVGQEDVGNLWPLAVAWRQQPMLRVILSGDAAASGRERHLAGRGTRCPICIFAEPLNGFSTVGHGSCMQI